MGKTTFAKSLVSEIDENGDALNPEKYCRVAGLFTRE